MSTNHQPQIQQQNHASLGAQQRDTIPKSDLALQGSNRKVVRNDLTPA
eukprot:CAMPEP_0168618702 /NCGR_PEP_ID=MMETSP0449_2-20121227/6211_1 /TAXON_ID=1082188 /ORGANISM="Strombidium rassoulzadegani, Strain ras09" /LENGTH=47 /DNA_ID= /DNA_START= /DNA_END= /DNA_ORIENTATION=